MIEKNKTTQTTYTDASELNGSFVVTEKRPTDRNDFAGINSTGVLNSNLEQVIPCEYALIKSLGSKHVVAYKITEITEDKSEALLYMTSNMFSLAPESGDTYYKGEWCVMELATGKKLEGLSGTEVADIYVNGDVIIVRIKNKADLRVSFDGTMLPENITFFSNGCYIPNNEYAVYSSNGEKLFTFDKNDHVSADMDPNYFLIGITDSSTYKTYYTLVDRTGAPISVSFEKRPTVYCGKFVCSNNVLYLLDGTKIVEGGISHSVIGID